MRHEFRTPLNSVIGFAQLLQNNPKDPLTKKQQEHIQYVVSVADHLVRLISDVLDLAEIENGKCALSVVDLEPTKVMLETVSMTQSLADKKSIQIERPHYSIQ